MTNLRKRRGVAAAAAAVVVAALIPFTAGPASAAVTLTGPTNPAIDTGQVYVFNTGASFIIEPGTYCLAATPSSPSPLVAVPATIPANQTSWNLVAAFPDPGTYTIGMVPALLGGTPCPGTADQSEFVSSASFTVNPVTTIGNITVTPVRPTQPVGGVQSFSVAVTGPTGTALPGRPVAIGYSGRGAGVLPGGFTNAGGTYVFNFPDPNPANTTNYSATLTIQSSDGGGNPMVTQAYVTYVPTGSITVTPTTASAAPGGTTGFTVTVKDQVGNPVNGATVYVASTGRNVYGARAVGVTNAIGQLAYTQTDTAGASSTVFQDTLTFSSNGKSVTATINYTGAGTLTANPATASVAFGASQQITVTLLNGSGTAVSGAAVTVAGTGRNAFASTSAGTTNASGQVVWTQNDAAGAGTTTPAQSVLTFTANGLTASSTLNYGAPTATVTVTSPAASGSQISSNGYFGVSATSSGVPAGTTAYVTLNGAAKASTTVQAGGNIRFDGTSIGGGQWIPAEAGNYAVRIGGGGSPVLATSSTFSLVIIPFGLNGRSGNRFSVQPGNFSPGTTVYLTRNSATVASGKVQVKEQAFTIKGPITPGTYQVWVASNQGRVYGDHAGVITIP
ncbi:MAG: hypothetical protein R2737_04065 [Candidatus Nanopelagicales bacterium]